LKQSHIGHAIAISAILVQAPRLVLALLAADRLPVAPSIERGLLVLTGIGTPVVLTGGNLYLARTVATVSWLLQLLSLPLPALSLRLPAGRAALPAKAQPQSQRLYPFPAGQGAAGPFGQRWLRRGTCGTALPGRRKSLKRSDSQ
jgi:hypothetical protein